MNQLSKFISGKRQELGLSLRGFAEMCGISHSYLDSLEKGVDARTGKPVSPTIETLEKLAAGLKISLVDLLNYGGYIDPADSSIGFNQMIDDELMKLIQEISPKLAPDDRRDLTEVIKIFVRKNGQKKK